MVVILKLFILLAHLKNILPYFLKNVTHVKKSSYDKVHPIFKLSNLWSRLVK